MRQRHRSKYRDILFILISSFIIVVAWIGFNIYHIYVTSTLSPDVQMKLTPIDGKFDMETFHNIKNREQVIPAFEKAPSATQSASNQPSLTPAIDQSASPSSSRFAPTDTPINRSGQ